MSEKSNIIEIKSDYKKIKHKWLDLHFNISFALVGFVFFVECIIGWGLYTMGEINIEMSHYLIKYLIAPVIINAIFVGIGYWGVHNSAFTQENKIYIVSLQFVAICFVIVSVHSIFTTLYLVFIIPIFFTMVYGNYILTTVTALSSIIASIFSVVFVTWDPDKISVIDNNIELQNFIISIIILCAFYVICIVAISFEKEKNIASIEKEIEHYRLRHRLSKDELTNINNRSALRTAFENMEEDKSGNNYIFVMIDIDNFKMVNDTLGHDKGDSFLKQFGSILQSNCEASTPFRFGGDEFCILFKNHKLENVVETCERIQKDIKELLMQNYIDLPLTASFGVAHYSYKMTPTKLLENADFALYSSKTVKDTIRVFNN